MNRRSFLHTSASGVLAAPLTDLVRTTRGARSQFRYSVCNEVFEKWDFARSCKTLRSAGFEGLEIAPFTLAEHLDEISPARRHELRNIMRSEGIEFVGLHWLLLTPKWLHLTTSNKEIREKSWEYFLKLIDFCADLGKGVMILGSPKQRGSQGNTVAEATAHLKEGLVKVASHASDRGATILIEPLPRRDTDVVNTLTEAVGMVQEINRPAIRTMFDFHNTVDEKEPLDVLVRRHFDFVRHMHINEMDGRHPGTGNLDFLPVFKVLADSRYSHWVSLEVFDFKPGPERIVRETMEFLRKLEQKLKS